MARKKRMETGEDEIMKYGNKKVQIDKYVFDSKLERTKISTISIIRKSRRDK